MLTTTEAVIEILKREHFNFQTEIDSGTFLGVNSDVLDGKESLLKIAINALELYILPMSKTEDVEGR